MEFMLRTEDRQDVNGIKERERGEQTSIWRAIGAHATDIDSNINSKCG